MQNAVKQTFERLLDKGTAIMEEESDAKLTLPSGESLGIIFVLTSRVDILHKC